VQVHGLPQGSRALRSLGLAAKTTRAKPRLYEQIEAVASANAASGAVVVELGFGPLPRWCTGLELQASTRLSNGVVRIRLLTLQIRVLEADAARIRAVARSALDAFGGMRFVGLEAAKPGRSRQRRPAEGLDVSVVFPSEFPFFAQNVVFIPRLRTVTETADFAAILSDLGVQHVRNGGMLHAARNQWRLPMRGAAPLAAFERALAAGLRAALYSAALPATSSTRLELVSRERRELECTLSRGLASADGCSRGDLERMEAFVLEHFGIELESLSQRVKIMPALAPHGRLWAGRAR